MLVSLHGGEGDREVDRVGGLDLGKEITRGVIPALELSDLGIHPQVHPSGWGELVGDVILEVVAPVIDVIVPGVYLLCVQDTCIMVSLHAHVIGCLGSTTLYVKVRSLVGGEFTEDHLVPVHVRIHVGVDSRACRFDALLREADGRSGVARLLRFVVELHPCGSVNELRKSCRDVKRILYCYVDAGTLIGITAFCPDDHHTIGTTRSVDGGGRGVLEDRKLINRLRGNVIEVSSTDLHVIKHDEWSRSTAKCADPSDVKFRGRARCATRCHGNDSGHLSGKRIGKRGGGHLERLPLDGGDGTGDADLLLCTGSDDHDLCQIGALGFHLHIDHTEVSYLDLLSGVANEGED